MTGWRQIKHIKTRKKIEEKGTSRRACGTEQGILRNDVLENVTGTIYEFTMSLRRLVSCPHVPKPIVKTDMLKGQLKFKS